MPVAPSTIPSSAPWIDAHCHLADPRLSSQLDAVLDRSRAARVGAWIQGGICPEDWDRQLAVRKRSGAGLILAYGLHPWWVAERTREEIDQALAHLRARLPEAQALGELGLDRSPKHGPKESLPLQEYAFESQLEIARSCEKPLVLHVVRAHGRTLELLRKRCPFPRGGIVHLFTGSYEVAREYLNLGFFLSIGCVDRPGFMALKEALPRLPADRLLVETDSPDQPFEGGADALNEPSHLPEIAAQLAKILGKTPEEILSQSARNLKTLFNIAEA